MSFTMLGFLLAVLPLLLLVTLLLCQRYPGERVIHRIRRLVELWLDREPSLPRGGDPVPRIEAMVRGGRLMASSMAGRGPPVPA